MKRRTRNYAKRQLTWMRKLAGVRVIDVSERDPAASRARDPRLRRLMSPIGFEKWQALGNDYLILERAELPFELTPGARPAPVRGALRRVRRRRAAALAHRRIPHTSPTCASSTQTARRRSCRATARARRSCTCAAAAGPTRTPSRSTPSAGEIRPTITGADTCRVDMGTASLTSKDYPGGAADGLGSVRSDGREWSFRHVSIGNPQCAIHVPSLAELEALDLPRDRAADRRRRAVPQPHERILVRRARGRSSRCGFAHPRADLRARRGGDAVLRHRRQRRRRRAHPARARRSARSARRRVQLDGGELEVEVGEDLRVNLTGWASPVFAGALSEDFEKELHETE